MISFNNKIDIEFDYLTAKVVKMVQYTSSRHECNHT